jgi:hypothetical protein
MISCLIRAPHYVDIFTRCCNRRFVLSKSVYPDAACIIIGDSPIDVAKIIEVVIPEIILGYMVDVCRNGDL